MKLLPENWKDQNPLEWSRRLTNREAVIGRARKIPEDSVLQKEHDLRRARMWNGENSKRFLTLARDPTKTLEEISMQLNLEFKTQAFNKNVLSGRLDRLRWVEKRWEWMHRSPVGR